MKRCRIFLSTRKSKAFSSKHWFKSCTKLGFVTFFTIHALIEKANSLLLFIGDRIRFVFYFVMNMNYKELPLKNLKQLADAKGQKYINPILPLLEET